jgi:hypothetical protein
MVSSFLASVSMLYMRTVQAHHAEATLYMMTAHTRRAAAVAGGFFLLPELTPPPPSAFQQFLLDRVPPLTTHQELLATIAFTTVCWLLAAFLAPQTDRETLIRFYRKVRPFGPGWGPVRAEAEEVIEAEGAVDDDPENIPLALLGWVAGCATIWSSLFTVGNFLYGRYNYAMILMTVFLASGFTLLRVINRLWK